MEKDRRNGRGKRKRKATEEAQAKGRHDRCLAGKKNLKVSFPLCKVKAMISCKILPSNLSRHERDKHHKDNVLSSSQNLSLYRRAVFDI